MSSLRTLFHGLCGAVVITAGLAAQDARDAIGPIEQKAVEITPENPVPRRTKTVAALYPEELRSRGATAIVMFVATVDESGRVVEIRKGGPGFEGRNNPLVLMAPGTAPDTAALKTAGDAFVGAAATALRQWQYDRPVQGPISFPVTFNFTTTSEPTASQDVSGRKLTAEATGTAGQPVRVGSGILPPTQTKKVAPVYPADAQAARVQGVVILEAVIGANGKVTEARVLRSVPLLDQPAIDAVRQWEYTPTLLNGAPVPVIMTVTVTFTMAPPPPPPPPPANQ
jgi:protein TonB